MTTTEQMLTTSETYETALHDIRSLVGAHDLPAPLRTEFGYPYPSGLTVHAELKTMPDLQAWAAAANAAILPAHDGYMGVAVTIVGSTRVHLTAWTKKL